MTDKISDTNTSAFYRIAARWNPIQQLVVLYTQTEQGDNILMAVNPQQCIDLGKMMVRMGNEGLRKSTEIPNAETF